MRTRELSVRSTQPIHVRAAVLVHISEPVRRRSLDAWRNTLKRNESGHFADQRRLPLHVQ